jgi:hypothetical protein
VALLLIGAVDGPPLTANQRIKAKAAKAASEPQIHLL